MKENIEALKKKIRMGISETEGSDSHCCPYATREINLLKEVLEDILKFSPDEPEFKAGDWVVVLGTVIEDSTDDWLIHVCFNEDCSGWVRKDATKKIEDTGLSEEELNKIRVEHGVHV